MFFQRHFFYGMVGSRFVPKASFLHQERWQGTVKGDGDRPHQFRFLNGDSIVKQHCMGTGVHDHLFQFRRG